MHRNRKILLAVVALVAAAGAVTALSQGKGTTKKAPDGDTPVPVRVVQAAAEAIPVYASALGTVGALNTVTVTPQVGGQLASVDFREGAHVEKGALLATIDARALQAAYDQAVAARRQNAAQLANARAQFARSNAPQYRQFVSRTDLDTLRSRIAEFEGAVAASDAAVRAARVQLQYSRVVAPIAGVAGMRNVDAGNVVAAGTPLVTLTQIRPIHVVFSLPERELVRLREAQSGGEVPVAAYDRDGARLLATGRLDVIDNRIGTDSGTFRGRAVFENDSDALWPGQFVSVRMRLGTIDRGIVVPTQAVLRGPDDEYVYVVGKDGTAAIRTVRTGVDAGDSRIQVVAGLAPGERVVTEGQFRLKPGSPVAVESAAGGRAAPAAPGLATR